MTTPLNILPENALLVTRGTSKTLQLFVSESHSGPEFEDGRRHRRPVDLTGARLLFTVKRRLEDPRPLFQKTSDSGSQIEIINAKAGLAQIYLLPEDTQYLEVRDYLFDAWVVLASGSRLVVIPTSVFSIQAGVTIIP